MAQFQPVVTCEYMKWPGTLLCWNGPHRLFTSAFIEREENRLIAACGSMISYICNCHIESVRERDTNEVY